MRLWTAESGFESLPPSQAAADLEEIRQYIADRYRERADRLEIGRIIHTAREQEFQRALDLLLRRS